ncbi:MAG: class I SAM-dependent methyltransferase [Nitrospinota bacterium]
MAGPFEGRMKASEDRNRVLRERGYDVPAMRARLVQCARPVSGKVLDVGTGPGRLAILLAKGEGAQVTTLEFEGEEIEFARWNAARAGVEARIRFLRGDAARLPFPPGVFDLVASANLIHHMDAPDLAVLEMVRVCKRGGRVVVADLNPAGLNLLAEVHAQLGGKHDAGPMTVSEAVERLSPEGLAIERWEEGFQVLFRLMRVA